MSVLGDVGPANTQLRGSFELHAVCYSGSLQHVPWGVV